MNLLETVIWGDTLQNWLLALLIVVAVILVIRLVERLLVRQARKFSRRTQTPADDFVVALVNRTGVWFLFIVSVYLGSLVLTLTPEVKKIIEHVVTIAFFIQAAIWGQSAINFWVRWYKRERLEEDADSVTVLSSLGLVGKLALWIVILLLIMDNLGVEVTSLIAGLGITGIAVALAVQNILGDLFASLSIVLDKPFVIGDFVVVDDFLGTVEKIGLKTTRVRSLTGEQLVFSNNDLLQSRIRNYQTLRDRRVVFSFGLLYETPPEKLEAVPGIVSEIISQQAETRFDRAHFKDFGESVLNFEVVYYMLTPDFAIYMDTQQAINLGLMRRFAEAGIRFAYPTQTVFVKQES